MKKTIIILVILALIAVVIISITKPSADMQSAQATLPNQDGGALATSDYCLNIEGEQHDENLYIKNENGDCFLKKGTATNTFPLSLNPAVR